MVLKVKLLSLKHKVPSDLFVVFETYNENPKNLDLKLSVVFVGSENVNRKHVKSLLYD